MTLSAANRVLPSRTLGWRATWRTGWLGWLPVKALWTWRCVLWAWQRRYGSCRRGAQMRHYDVAVWRWWPSLFPEWCEVVEAANPFEAVETVMWRHGCMSVQHAAAQTRDGLVAYRCFGVRLTPWWQGGSRRLVKHPWELEAGGAMPRGASDAARPDP
jgi:hypothetical protein